MRRWHLLADLCIRHGLRRVVELGVREGRLAGHLLASVPESHVTGVDLWRVQPPRAEPGAETYDGWPMARYRAAALALAARNPGRCRMLELATDEAALVVPDGSLDLVFVDADHTERAVARDIATWTPKVGPGGLLAGHDIHWPSVHRAVAASGPFEEAGHDHVWLRWIR
jgi:hypothetical protein